MNGAGWMPVSPEGWVCAVLGGAVPTIALVGHYWGLVAKSSATVTVIASAGVCYGFIFCKGSR
jgi:hypothetical protein